MEETVPYNQAYVIKQRQKSTVEEREKLLELSQYNAFNFPANFLAVDYCSDSGSSAMFISQWSSMFYGDESYGRNDGYFILLEALRDTFEREKQACAFDLMTSVVRPSVDELCKKLLFPENVEGSFFNSGVKQLESPNTFITPQGRCAEFLLFDTLKEYYSYKFGSETKDLYIPSNGFFDTTRANCQSIRVNPVDFFDPNLTEVTEELKKNIGKVNPFKGNMPIDKFRSWVEKTGVEHIPFVIMTITNNTAGGQPISLKNLKEVKKVCDEFGLPLWIDACRFSENAYFIKKYEKEYSHLSVHEIVIEIFKLASGFHISLKKDGLANMGGGIFIKDQGAFQKKFTEENFNFGVKLKQKQITTFGNDSYGGMSGRDMMALARGLYEVVKEEYLSQRIGQVEYFAQQLTENNIPIVLPPGGHAIFIDMNQFFPDRKWQEFPGVGLVAELIKRYAIRACELGPFAFEWDQRKVLPDPLPPHLVRLAIPRNVYNKEHFDYTVKALAELLKDRDSIPSMEIVRGEKIALRHFVAGLKPIYKKKE